jgi:hypothetical protein
VVLVVVVGLAVVLLVVVVGPTVVLEVVVVGPPDVVVVVVPALDVVVVVVEHTRSTHVLAALEFNILSTGLLVEHTTNEVMCIFVPLYKYHLPTVNG